MAQKALVFIFLRRLWPYFLMFLVFGFALYAVNRGFSADTPQEALRSRFIHSQDLIATWVIYAHMVSGGLLTFLAPVQLMHPLRRRWPVAHRATGYVIAGLALITSVFGALYILRQGTIGGPLMNTGFGLYGLLLGIAAVQTVRLARAGNVSHRNWALRLIVLALGSWLYRVHYAIWEISTDGLGSRPDFTGIFDQVQVFGFYLPYLLLLELWLRRNPLPTSIQLRLWAKQREHQM
ncbi:MAG: DUF2306 domain-containing protein [Arenibacterium sp.]